uniref:Uncharacterized protein n=1 Tax=Oryza brachyantha TaxID=4533 RepID=J3LNV6_ORYBR
MVAMAVAEAEAYVSPKRWARWPCSRSCRRWYTSSCASRRVSSPWRGGLSAKEDVTCITNPDSAGSHGLTHDRLFTKPTTKTTD